ncbi:MAG TPA: ATP-binding protein [Pyrinomonadaceae bacterium]|nr:ATP-binding protein [Pyrinomonadaceae bacterium]
MILAISRFKVANGMEAEVREAFLNRPGFVDSVKGFLGMETYTAKTDSSIFYLVTRWSDQDSFHTWHHSKEHHESHRFIPKGLKLDGSFTEVIELERIDPATTHRSFYDCAMDTAPLLARFINQSDGLHFIATDADGKICQVNHAVARRTRRPVEELEGTSIFDHLTETDRDTVRARLKQGTRPLDEITLLNFVDRNNAPYSLICKIDVMPEGLVIIGEAPAKKEEALQTELFELNNELAALSRENVRKKRALEQALKQLKEAQAMLVQQEKMASLGQMTAGVAHEINNPIAFVLTNHETLLRDFQELLGFVNIVGDSLDELSSTNPGFYQRIVHEAEKIDLSHLVEIVPKKIGHNLEGLERVKRIVLDLRSFSRLDENSYKPADINEGITSTLRFLSPLIAAKSVRVKTVLTEMRLVNCSPGTLNQAFSNIIANAVQASPPNGEVIVSTSEEDGFCVVTVEDHGEGIAAEHLAKIFDPFFTTKPVGSGTGLGLHITRQIVTAHQGEILVASEKNIGTTVTIRIPFGREHPAPTTTISFVETGEQTWPH